MTSLIVSKPVKVGDTFHAPRVIQLGFENGSLTVYYLEGYEQDDAYRVVHAGDEVQVGTPSLVGAFTVPGELKASLLVRVKWGRGRE